METWIYRGRRDKGDAVVDVMSLHNGHEVAKPARLDSRTDLFNHSPTGFEWGYGGSGPAQLALAILAHHLKHNPSDLEILRAAGVDIDPDVFEQDPRLSAADRAAVKLHQRFKFAVVANLHRERGWLIDTGVVREVLRALAYGSEVDVRFGEEVTIEAIR